MARHRFQMIKSFGGLIKRPRSASGRFQDAGEKLWFWFGVLLLGVIVSASGAG
jgi:formate dehydrogenase subunit gamma